MIKGYKVFLPDWTCLGKRYTCPGKFEEDVKPELCHVGMHFCPELVNCFSYYDFNPANHIAEVIAYGDTAYENDGDKVCTNKLEIVREITWAEAMSILNVCPENFGICNTGHSNYGNYNAADANLGHSNTGYRNKGDFNTGEYNEGDCNSGARNIGRFNSGRHNKGNWNTGDNNTGDLNTGHYNIGRNNTGDFNLGDDNTGCFNTKPQTISFFNKPSCWTLDNWKCSWAYRILTEMPQRTTIFKGYHNMTEEEKATYDTAETTNGVLLTTATTKADRQKWWNALYIDQKQAVMSMPNFDKDIFYEITGIDVTQEGE